MDRWQKTRQSCLPLELCKRRIRVLGNQFRKPFTLGVADRGLGATLTSQHGKRSCFPTTLKQASNPGSADVKVLRNLLPRKRTFVTCLHDTLSQISEYARIVDPP